ncbi:MAG: transketolase [Candidatus Omnitrophica bacterium]|nr:transketolase [Candidatus Omnitrophota bacterium]
METKIKLLENKALQIRKLVIEMITKAGSGHPGGSLSAIDIITCLYFEVMNFDPKNPNLPNRDRFHLSKGHSCPALYAALALVGYFPVEELMKLRQLNSFLQGHPDRRTPGVEVASGSLGQGLSVALGMAFAARIDKLSYRVYCLLGDGEIQEGNVWEAAMAAAHYKVDNLCAIVDNNHFQIDGPTEEIMNLEPLASKWEAFGWHVIQCDGHNFRQLIEAFSQAKMVKFKPTVIIANTIKGKGVSFMEGVVDFHGRAPTEKEKEIALKELENIENK